MRMPSSLLTSFLVSAIVTASDRALNPDAEEAHTPEESAFKIAPRQKPLSGIRKPEILETGAYEVFMEQGAIEPHYYSREVQMFFDAEEALPVPLYAVVFEPVAAQCVPEDIAGIQPLQGFEPGQKRPSSHFIGADEYYRAVMAGVGVDPIEAIAQLPSDQKPVQAQAMLARLDSCFDLYFEQASLNRDRPEDLNRFVVLNIALRDVLAFRNRMTGQFRDMGLDLEYAHIQAIDWGSQAPPAAPSP